jgi:hypothetical protein
MVCCVLVVSLKTTMEKRYISDGLTHCVLVWRKVLFVNLSFLRYDVYVTTVCSLIK